ncbi:hypothetical protein MTO96_024424 [Rhipicephalus appendiculatus]
MLPGPFRAATKPGVFITMLAVFDIYAKHHLIRKDDMYGKITVRGTVGGYAVDVTCWLTQDGDEVVVYFGLSLCDGEWNQYLEWPFSKKVTVIVTHLSNSEKDIRLPVYGEIYHELFLKKPAPDSCNLYVDSEKVNWKDP